ncbi:hypothetical protein GGI04_003086 [Coemansia thaxteri]|nr:hypothetical protein GGI04_003086 [Coemansia thaxteri]
MVGGSRATDPLNDIGSPVSLQYLQFAMSSPFFISGGSNGGGPVAAGAGAGAGGKREAAPAVVVTGTLSPLLDDSLSGFIHPAEVFTTPEMRQMSDVTQKTPDLALFDDADAIMSALSPRTQTAQAGLSLLAASATYARSPGAGRGDEAAPVGSPFLNALGVDATLMSQPQNSLAHQLSPPLADQHHHYYYYHQQQQQRQFLRPAGGGAYANHGPGLAGHAGTGRLTRNRSLLRQSSGLTSASFHNDLVPHPTESFFAPLDEVCGSGGGGGDTDIGSGSARSAVPAAARYQHRQSQQPRMGSQFSPVMGAGPAQAQAGYYAATPAQFPPVHGAQPSQGLGQSQNQNLIQNQNRSQNQAAAAAALGSSSIPGLVFAQMPSLNAPRAAAAAAAAAAEDEDEAEDGDSEDDDGGVPGGARRAGSAGSEASDVSASDSPSGKRRRVAGAAPHKRDRQRRFDCDVCQRSFARQYNLKTHRLTHFPDAHASRPFKCPHCPKAFTRKHDLQRHAVLHERTDKYTCPRCHAGFQRKDAMKKHLDNSGGDQCIEIN